MTFAPSAFASSEDVMLRLNRTRPTLTLILSFTLTPPRTKNPYHYPKLNTLIFENNARTSVTGTNVGLVERKNIQLGIFNGIFQEYFYFYISKFSKVRIPLAQTFPFKMIGTFSVVDMNLLYHISDIAKVRFSRGTRTICEGCECRENGKVQNSERSFSPNVSRQ